MPPPLMIEKKALFSPAINALQLRRDKRIDCRCVTVVNCRLLGSLLGSLDGREKSGIEEGGLSGGYDLFGTMFALY